MLLNLFYILAALVGAALSGLTVGLDTLAAIPVFLLGFVLTFALCLLVCYLVVWYLEKHTDTTREQEEDDPLIRRIVKLYAGPVFRLLGCRIRTAGTEKLPTQGRFLLVCNHLQDMDPGIPLTIFPDAQLAFIAKKEVAGMPIIGTLMRRILCQFIDRENDREALKTILKCIAILKEDKASVAVFPEGRITKDGKLLHNFRPGVFKIAQKANVPIVVCTMNGTQNIMKNLKKFRRTTIDFHLVEVIPAEELKGVTTVQIADRVHAIMAADLGPENVAC
jgi:1-acyl-sn-glycerol-3-phosphate acyltransferase